MNYCNHSSTRIMQLLMSPRLQQGRQLILREWSVCRRHWESPVCKGPPDHRAQHRSCSCHQCAHTFHQKCHTADPFLPTFPQEDPPNPFSPKAGWRLSPCRHELQCTRGFQSCTRQDRWESARVWPTNSPGASDPRSAARTKTLQLKWNTWKTTVRTSLMTERKGETATSDLSENIKI